MKALPIDVYRDGGIDCTNNGISSKYDRLLLVCTGGFIEIDETNKDRAVIILEGFQGYKYLEPIYGKDESKCGYMMGGNFGYTSDGRYPFDYPLPIHDRQETWEQYDKLSR